MGKYPYTTGFNTSGGTDFARLLPRVRFILLPVYSVPRHFQAIRLKGLVLFGFIIKREARMVFHFVTHHPTTKLAPMPIFLPVRPSHERLREENARKYMKEDIQLCAPLAPTPANSADAPSFSTCHSRVAGERSAASPASFCLQVAGEGRRQRGAFGGKKPKQLKKNARGGVVGMDDGVTRRDAPDC